MPNEWTGPSKGRKSKQPKKSSGGGGSGTTVGMAIALVGLPGAAIFATFGYVLIARFFA